jgi:hypothetical protein
MKKWIIIFIVMLMIPMVNAEILSGTTERDCANGKCVYTTTQSDRFLNYGGKWLYFNQFATLNTVGNDLIYSTPISTSATNTNVNLSIWVTYNGRDQSLNSLTSTQISSFNPKYVLSKGRDEYKFNLTFVKPREITRIGFKVSSNREFSYTSLTGYVDNIVSNNMELSLQDLIESNYTISLDKITGIYWIDISRLTGTITLDPISSFYSLSNDQSLLISETDYSCTGVGIGTRTMDIGQSADTQREYGMFEFNTSTIASDQQIDYANLSIYNSLIFDGGCALSTQSLNYLTKGGVFGTVGCEDLFTTTVSAGTLSWGGSTGWKTKTIATNLINRTTSTLFQITPNWARYTCEGSGYFWVVRTADYTGTTYDPILTVVTSTISTGICGTSYTGTGDWYINQNTNCTSITYDGRNIGGNIIVNGSYTFDVTNQTLNISYATNYIMGLSNSNMIGVYA